MGLFKNRKWKENQADKIAKNKKRSIEPSGYINSDYQLVDISIRSMYDLIDRVREFTDDTKILGTARLIQRVSQIIAAVRIDTDDMNNNIADIDKMALYKIIAPEETQNFQVGDEVNPIFTITKNGAPVDVELEIIPQDKKIRLHDALSHDGKEIVPFYYARREKQSLGSVK